LKRPAREAVIRRNRRFGAEVKEATVFASSAVVEQLTFSATKR
jgi:hypothetical protein